MNRAIQNATEISGAIIPHEAFSLAESSLPPFPPDSEIEVFFDSECPLCRREVNVLKLLNRRKKIAFEDIASLDFDASKYGKTYAELMAQLHGRLPSGEWVIGVEVIRRLYAAIGFGWVVPITRLPGISSVLNWSYAIFARNRLRLTGRCNTEVCVRK